jgi:hypothetical protein
VRIIIRLLTILEKSYDYFRITYRKNIELNHLYRQINLDEKKGVFGIVCLESLLPLLLSACEKTSIFATNRNIKKISAPLQSRVFIAKVEQYTNGQFREITKRLVSTHKLEGEIAELISDAVWNKSQCIKDRVKIGYNG